jgi:hypothetical protein
MSQPPGHIPGLHLPGTLIPIGAVVAEQERNSREYDERLAARRRANLLLLYER